MREFVAMIDREQVTRVARLAALRLSEQEMQRMERDLGGILDHVEQISELDLSSIEPSPQVVELSNVLRPDVPRPGLEREKALQSAPDPVDGAFRVPSTQAE
jgi:aspartyl-tRNA(Asn)/glutamyl-tRNA(Gln) amidotransferase subunit C